MVLYTGHENAYGWYPAGSSLASGFMVDGGNRKDHDVYLTLKHPPPFYLKTEVKFLPNLHPNQRIDIVMASDIELEYQKFRTRFDSIVSGPDSPSRRIIVSTTNTGRLAGKNRTEIVCMVIDALAVELDKHATT